MKDYVIGLDIGTTCAKALAVDTDGRVLTAKSGGYRLVSSGSKIEQRTEDWIDAARFLLREITLETDGARPLSLSISSQGASTTAVDAMGKPLGNAITWMDTRSIGEAEEIERELGGDFVYRTTGWRINPALDAAKIRHMRRDPAFDGAAKYLSTLEIINAYLTGNGVIDPTNAAIRQLFDVEAGKWSDKLMRAAGISEKNLPEVLPTGALVGGLTPAAARETGLPEGLPVFNGAHDQYCASLGAGAVRDGDMLLSAGTTWVLLGVSREPMFTKSYIAPGKHPAGGLYGAIASLVCSGASLQWFVDEFLPDGFDAMNRAVSERREKTRDLFFHPYLAGAGYPIWNLQARGSFTGLLLEHDRFDLARAVMEGVAFGVRRGVEDFRANGTQIRRITIMGGAAKSDIWCEMIADIARVPIERLNVTDVCALGAAAIAMKSAGICDSYEEAAYRMAKPERLFEPNAESASYFDEKLARYDCIWQCMSTCYRETRS